MYFAQLDNDTGKCIPCVVAEKIVIEKDIKFHSENEQEVIDFCEKWNRVNMILYKAKRMDTAEWVEGNLLKLKCDDSENGYMYYIIPEVTNGSWCKSNAALKFISPCFEVDSDTICQYIGLDDKNIRKIFEGDIVKIDGEDEEFTIGWDAACAMFDMNSETLCANFDNYYSYEVEVIGNIHNKENEK